MARRQPTYQTLGSEARDLVDRWCARLAHEPVESAEVFRYLVAMVAVRHGELREVARAEFGGWPLVVLVDAHDDGVSGVTDPLLGDAEEGLVDEIERLLGGPRRAAAARTR
jgi:hypothetical protein